MWCLLLWISLKALFKLVGGWLAGTVLYSLLPLLESGFVFRSYCSFFVWVSDLIVHTWHHISHSLRCIVPSIYGSIYHIHWCYMYTATGAVHGTTRRPFLHLENRKKRKRQRIIVFPLFSKTSCCPPCKADLLLWCSSILMRTYCTRVCFSEIHTCRIRCGICKDTPWKMSGTTRRSFSLENRKRGKSCSHFLANDPPLV